MPKKGQTWSPEQRAKIMAAKTKEVGLGNAENAPHADKSGIDQRPGVGGTEPRRRLLQAIPEKPKGSRWNMKVGSNRWSEATEDTNEANQLQIAADLIPEGITLQWVTSEVYGKEETQRRASFEKTGWIPVHPEDFDGRFDGMYAPKGAQGEINYHGLVLMAKPTEMVARAKAKERQKAKNQVQIKEQELYGGGLNAMGADHPTALRTNKINRSYERLTIPQDE